MGGSGLRSELSRRSFLSVTAAGLVGCAHRAVVSEAGGPGAERRPNIIVIVSDDQGYADSGCYGCADVPTPGIDSLARDGVRFTDGYVSCPVCSPTRAGLLTGRYQQRFGWEKNPGPAHLTLPHVGLSLDEVTLADILRGAGYRTGVVGKWHLGVGPEFHPMRRGFDEFYGFLGGSHHYLPGKGGEPIRRNDTPVEDYEYLTDAFGREAVAFIRRHASEPFFLYLPFNAVHLPPEVTARYLDRFPDIENKRRRTYAAMLSAMDDAIGEVRKALREEGLDKNTLIFFHSDNGGPEKNGSSNSPLRGWKGQMYEGGVRVPFLVSWPGVIPAGRVISDPVISLDILPTAAAAAGAKPPDDRIIDGVNLLPLLTEKRAFPPHGTLFWRKGDAAACRSGDWKLVMHPDGTKGLYDLASDIGEENDLATGRPEILSAMLAEYAEWERGMVNPPPEMPRRGRRARGR